MQHIFGSIPDILKEINPTGEAIEPIVFAAWDRCVDGVLAENVVPVRLENNKLIAAVSNETWRRNISDLGPALRSKLNTAMGSPLVKYIDFQIDPAAVAEARSRSKKADEERTERSAVADQIADELRTVADSIADEELREQFIAAAASSLARRSARQD